MVKKLHTKAKAKAKANNKNTMRHRTRRNKKSNNIGGFKWLDDINDKMKRESDRFNKNLGIETTEEKRKREIEQQRIRDEQTIINAYIKIYGKQPTQSQLNEFKVQLIRGDFNKAPAPAPSPAPKTAPKPAAPAQAPATAQLNQIQQKVDLLENKIKGLETYLKIVPQKPQ